MSRATESGIYELIEEYYEKLGTGEFVDLEHYNATNLTLWDLFVDNGHYPLDMLIRYVRYMQTIDNPFGKIFIISKLEFCGKSF